MARKVTTVTRRRTSAYAKASRRKKALFSAKNKATSKHKTFARGNVFAALVRGIGLPVRTVFGKGRRTGHKQYRYKT